MPLQQQKRSLSVFTPLGEDVLLLRGMKATEALGRLFEYELELISDNIDIKHEDLLGQSVSVHLSLPNAQQRCFNGIVNRFSQVGFDGALAVYQATLVPWTWFLTRTADCRIFQDQTVPDIIKAIFREHGYTDFEERLSETYRQWIYCVQYRETDFNFISRLMEQEGLYYYFTHQDGKHTLILADNYGAHGTAPGYSEIPYYPPDKTALRERDHIHHWSVVQKVQPGAFAHTDFDFTAPRKNLLTKRSSPKTHEHAELEVYDYPGEYIETSDGEAYARVRLEELHAGYETVCAEGNARGLTTGHLFHLINYPRDDQNREYLIVSAEYRLQSDQFGSTADLPSDNLFHCSLTAMDAQVVFRPPRSTPKPIVQGPQTAIVVGKAGEEIWTDQYGRVKVQFHWDRYGKSDETSSCWVRVSHPWAGKNWGAIAIPRIGQEVIVEFLEGDPDRPIITGRIYNGDQMPPYGLPAGAVVSGLKSNSTKGGGGYNEYIMDDTKGNELIREHGQFDKDSTIENDLREHVLHDRSRDVTNNESIQIGVNRTETVGNNETTSIGANRSENVGQHENVTVALTRTHTIGVNDTLNVGAANEVSVGGLQTISVGLNRSVDVGINQSHDIGSNRSTSVGKDDNVQVGKNRSDSIGDNRSTSIGKDDSLKVGKNLVIDAGDSITIKTGKASISMKKDGTITIQGKDINVKGSGGINIKASKNVVIKGQKILEN
ncbi:MAG TPA: type VI secretion system tip protein VgrG [Chromatiaceae bacterium]|jgi:type VI secretion system secreted protein VgrG|nr:MAG: hypothetical protein N838_10905 [Thiohalocapsa sp. PB-PSB1]QQO54623.1 MAG: type VI secretion system tip protein VgrG [Thiohalocapsa sp. PB-PSB1]HBG95689.1 type VI secretion system tip protein VgrG [Chromatiaceae bacterium]HCS92748.1 type VI secretion system tip protein VgrG [Chromatiaceae bacterium]